MLSLLIVPLALTPVLAQYTATYYVGQLPDSSEQGQSGTNQCGSTASQTSMCQNAYVNSIDDFCLWAPPSDHSDEGDHTSKIGNVEQNVVSYCLKDGYGTRLIPQGTITAAHFVQVVNDKVSYVQVTGTGDFTKMMIPAGDEGGELDPHSWTGLGNPQGGLVFTNAFSGQFEQTHEWTSFISANDFCIRACKDGPNAPGYCQHIYDTLSCGFTIPGSMEPGFDQCDGDPTDEAPGVYGGSTFHQGDPTTPAPPPPGNTYGCKTVQSVGGGSANLAANPTGMPSNSTSVSSSMSTSTSMSSSAGSAKSSSGPNTSSATAVISPTPTSSPSTPSIDSTATAAAQSSGASAPRFSAGGWLASIAVVLGAIVV